MTYRYPTTIKQHGPPRPAWQTFSFWWFWFTEGLTAACFIGGATGVVIATAWIMEWLGF